MYNYIVYSYRFYARTVPTCLHHWKYLRLLLSFAHCRDERQWYSTCHKIGYTPVVSVGLVVMTVTLSCHLTLYQPMTHICVIGW